MKVYILYFISGSWDSWSRETLGVFKKQNSEEMLNSALVYLKKEINDETLADYKNSEEYDSFEKENARMISYFLMILNQKQFGSIVEINDWILESKEKCLCSYAMDNWHFKIEEFALQ